MEPYEYLSRQTFQSVTKKVVLWNNFLADICRAVGVEVFQNSQLFSDCMCLILANPCVLNIRKYLGAFNSNAIGNESAVQFPKLQQSSRSTCLMKQLLETTSGNSHSCKTVRVNSSVLEKASHKFLRFEATDQKNCWVSVLKNDLLESNLNIDDLTAGEELQLKIVIVNSLEMSLQVFPEESKQLCSETNIPDLIDELNTCPSPGKTSAQDLNRILTGSCMILTQDPDKILHI